MLVILGVRAQLEPEIPNNVAAASTSQNVGDVGVMPSSLSQIDASALQEYPQEIRDEIHKYFILQFVFVCICVMFSCFDNFTAQMSTNVNEISVI